MKEKMDLFGVGLDMLTAKAAMKKIMGYMEGETVSTVAVVSLETLLLGQDDSEWKKQIGEMQLRLAGEAEIFEAVPDVDQRFVRDLKGQVFWRMLLRYLQRNKKKVFLLAEDEHGLTELRETVRAYEKGLPVAGSAVLPPQSGLEEKIVNEINGVEPDCIFSAIPSPRQERFISGCRAVLNARLWMGCGPVIMKAAQQKNGQGRLRQFFLKKRFLHQVERQKNRTDI